MSIGAQYKGHSIYQGDSIFHAEEVIQIKLVHLQAVTQCNPRTGEYGHLCFYDYLGPWRSLHLDQLFLFLPTSHRRELSRIRKTHHLKCCTISTLSGHSPTLICALRSTCFTLIYPELSQSEIALQLQSSPNFTSSLSSSRLKRTRITNTCHHLRFQRHRQVLPHGLSSIIIDQSSSKPIPESLILLDCQSQHIEEPRDLWFGIGEGRG
ncbi:hypothetical protein K435DRAFT_867315 [Dendrothele bispora CBS 962.96]|uniref:Uncharacterized protein n=1 Tax=Dendrothele bispora (strain CBS 962.96) TaxID=1314807 RepID=A0A4S8LFB6_DENBC|nr:hypothetical protein K435DRAFT_867315 [Dendrothele bispora CBS 962.96]